MFRMIPIILDIGPTFYTCFFFHGLERLGPGIWNLAPGVLKELDDIYSFKTGIKKRNLMIAYVGCLSDIYLMFSSHRSFFFSFFFLCLYLFTLKSFLACVK